MLGLVLECVVGYTFWSLFHALGPLIWFYPLNELDITGYEAFVVVVFSPVLWLLGRHSQRALKSQVCQVFCHLLMLVGVVSFQAETTLTRLVMLSVGVGAGFLVKASSWWSEDKHQAKQSFWGYTLGYFMLLATRIWYKSITPAWSDVYSNKLLSTVFSIVFVTKIFNSLKLLQPSQKVLSPRGQSPSRSETASPATKKNSLLCSVAYGCLCYLMHTILGEVSVLSRYTVRGLAVSSPSPNPWGGLVLLAAIFGFIMSAYSEMPSNKLWLLCGVLSSVGLMFLDTWAAFASGLFFISFLVSVWPSVAENLINCACPGRSLLVANFFYLLGVFGMVWCTAYNFVPFGGELARERTYVIMVLFTALVSLSLLKSRAAPTPIRIKLLLPPKVYYEKRTGNTRRDELIKKLMFATVLFGLMGFQYRKMQVPQANLVKVGGDKAPTSFSALIWTFHFGYDNEGWPSLERAAQVLNASGADVITLLESDASKPYLGNNDIAMWLSERLGMYADFGPSTRDHTWGTMLLSKYPIVKSEHHLLPSPEGELAPAISATINMTGELVNFVVTHMGNDRDDLDRQLQAKRLSELASASEYPVVFLGYVTSRPGSRDYRYLTKHGRLHDIDPTDRHRWCEYIMYRDLRRLGYARISHSGLSDTELQMAKWEFYGALGSTADNERIASPHDKVADEVKFNPKFGDRHIGHWYGKSHHFHMSTPKYFVRND